MAKKSPFGGSVGCSWPITEVPIQVRGVAVSVMGIRDLIWGPGMWGPRFLGSAGIAHPLRNPYVRVKGIILVFE